MKSRWWTFTNFDMDFDWDQLFESEDSIKYIAYGRETCPSTNRPHHQGWLYVKNALHSTKKLLGTMHAESMRGTIDQNDTYCSKESKLTTLGIKPKQGNRRDIADIMDSIKNGETDIETAENNPSQWVQYGRRFEDFRRLIMPRRTWKSEVFVFWGAAETGKTKKCWEMAPDAADVSWHNGFCIGYHGEEDVIIDDFEDTAIPRNTFLKMTDRYPMVMNVKNGEINWSPKRIFITSNYPPESWYALANADPAVMRRLDHVEKCDFILAQQNGTEVPMGNTVP